LTAAGGTVTRAELAGHGLSTREIEELCTKLQPSTPPEFELDLSKAKTGEELARRFEAAVPSQERKAAAAAPTVPGGD
jgi:hypothetical protein